MDGSVHEPPPGRPPIRITRASLPPVLFLSLLLVPAGCGDDEPGRPAGTIIDVKDGTWSVVTRVSTLGTRPECDRPDTLMTEERFLCKRDLSRITEVSAFPFEPDCKVALDNDRFSIDCVNTFEDGSCSVEYSGSGQFTPLMYTFVVNREITTAEGKDTCLGLPDCIQTVSVQAVWVSDVGADQCEDPGDGEGVPVARLIERTLASLPR